MCDILFLNDANDTEIDSIGELIKLFPEPITHEGGVFKGRLDQCLCPIDLPATAEKYGRKITTGDHVWYDLQPYSPTAAK